MIKHTTFLHFTILNLMMILCLSHAHATPVHSKSSGNVAPKVIYGRDNRVFVEESFSRDYQDNARAVAIMFKDSMLSDIEGSEEEVLFTKSTLEDTKFQVCEDQAHSQKVSTGDCTGFLVGEKWLLTAGHCINTQRDCDEANWYFDYNARSFQKKETLERSKLYKCSKILERKKSRDTGEDFALIELERVVEDVEPLSFRMDGRVELGTPLYVIGHPLGLPKMVADDGYVRFNDDSFLFQTNLDTFRGNSGSPIFNADTGLVEGLLVSGERDFIWDSRRKCNRVKMCDEDKCRGESVVRITSVRYLFHLGWGEAENAQSINEDFIGF